jgi:hypothetical protein
MFDKSSSIPRVSEKQNTVEIQKLDICITEKIDYQTFLVPVIDRNIQLPDNLSKGSMPVIEWSDRHFLLFLR